MLSTLSDFRKQLHQFPELSGQEFHTAQTIKIFLQTHYPTQFIENIGGHGLAAIYSFGETGPTILIRCELDALPIEEPNTFPYHSTNKGVSHKCGHDGHIAIVAGLVFWLKEQKFNAGKVVLLFQPAEETGKGAYQVLKDKRFTVIQPDYVFALHNLPGEPFHSIIIKPNSFSASVQSMAIHFEGKEAHASDPENGINPAIAIATIIQQIAGLNQPDVTNDNFCLATLVHSTIGTKAYGISPGYGELHYTLRAWQDNQRKQLEAQIEEIITGVCKEQHLTNTIEYLEYFPSTHNHPEGYDLIKQIAIENGMIIRERPIPLKFGEDFGWFSKDYKAAMFGLGAGLDTPALHHATYDFPDELIPTGIRMFSGIISKILSR